VSVIVLRPGSLATVQDLGRAGLRHLGVVPGGAMDPASHRIANALVGNRSGEASLEIALSGPDLLITEEALIALYGARFTARLDGKALPASRPVLVPAGARLRIGRAEDGFFGYLAIAGGFDVPEVLGSRSTYVPGGFGGWQGKAVGRDATLPLIPGVADLSAHRFKRISRRAGASGARWRSVTWFAPSVMASPGDSLVVRAIPGVHHELFKPAAREAFFGERWRVGLDSNRMGLRLAGPPLALAQATEILSQPTCRGTVQVPAGGQPIVLMADHQTTGGYPKIAEVIAADVPRLAQVPPGRELRFARVTLEEADAARAVLSERVDVMIERILWEFGNDDD
jgi:antagonist of KipI